MSKILTDQDFCDAASDLRCEVAAIKSVAIVESAKGGFDSFGRIILRFERHRFQKYTNGKYNKSHPNVSAAYKAGQPGGRNLFNIAFKLDPTAALLSTSWGRFQIMGDEHKRCGFDNVHAFVEAMKTGERAQLDAFVKFCISKKLDGHIRTKNWAKFAEGYNGPGYKDNKYDTKMASHYAAFSKKKIDCSKVAAIPQQSVSIAEAEVANSEPVEQPEAVIESATVETPDATTTIATINEQPVTETAQVSGGEPYQGIGFWKVIKRDLTAATGGNLTFAGVAEYAQQASGWPEWVVGIISKVAVGVLIATFGYFIFRVVHYCVDRWQNNQRVKTEAEAKTAIDRKDIEWI